MGFGLLVACAQADEPEAQVSDPDAAVGGSSGQAGASGGAGVSGQAGMGASAGEGAQGGTDTGGTGGSAGASGGGPTGGTGGYAGTGGTGVPDAGDEGGIVCGGETCTNWLCEKTSIGLSMTVFGCCQSTNECGAVNEKDGNLCVPVEVVEAVLDLECKPN